MKEKITISVHYIEDENGKKILDEDMMRDEIALKLSEWKFEEEKDNSDYAISNKDVIRDENGDEVKQ